jgi:outer membrane biosynthesis protein TonB
VLRRGMLIIIGQGPDFLIGLAHNPNPNPDPDPDPDPSPSPSPSPNPSPSPSPSPSPNPNQARAPPRVVAELHLCRRRRGGGPRGGGHYHGLEPLTPTPNHYQPLASKPQPLTHNAVAPHPSQVDAIMGQRLREENWGSIVATVPVRPVAFNLTEL